MCGRFSLTDPYSIYARFHLANRIDLAPRYNVTPTQVMPVFDQPKHVELVRWGLIPFWAKDPNVGYSMINARAEGIAEKPSYRKPFRFQRCIIPADGFFEWKQTKDGKVPYYFKLKRGGLFGFAGLYDLWKDPHGHEVNSYTIITTTPNELVGNVHDRMPVILRRDDEDDWLNPDIVEPERLEHFLHPYPAAEMDAYAVSTLVNSPKNDAASLVTPV